MIAEGLLSSVAKVAVVAGLTAGGAAGVYFVATRSGIGDDPSPSAGIVATTTVTGGDTPTPGGETPTAGETATPTPIPGLTDTGYLAPDGRPLYAECVEGVPLPPQYAIYLTPIGSVPVPSPIPPEPGGSATPLPGAVPDFDPLALVASDSSGWPELSSPCVSLSFRYPSSLQILSPLQVGGYQQGAAFSAGTPDRRVVFDFTYSFTPADILGIVQGSPVPEGEYRLVNHQPVAIGGALGYVSYGTVFGGFHDPQVAIIYTVSPRPDWYLQVTGFFAAPYDPIAFQEFQAFVGSLTAGP